MKGGCVRVGIDARKLFDGGIGTYIRGLLGALAARPPAQELVALMAPEHLGRIAWPAGGVREVPVRARKYGLWEHVVVPRAARRAGVTLLHAPHYTLPLGWGGPAVVTIHDLIHLRFPGYHPPGAALYARVMAGAAVLRSRAVIVDSTHTRNDVIDLLGAPAERVHIVPLGVSAGLRPPPGERVLAWRSARGLPADYLLYVGARKRHKNLALLLEALATLPSARRPPLVLSGEAWDGDDALARLASRLGVTSRIHFAGAVRDEESLACLYAGAALYVQPSLGEGFGLPPLEAMACGTPVLCSDAGALPETVGDAARQLPPDDAASWGQAVVDLLDDTVLRSELVRRGLERARQFTWERTAERTAAIYQAAAG
jgi:glycosyltransferase involved in cell wall biosynthesis